MARTKAFDENTALDKAMSLFWSKGYHDTSMQNLVDHLGLSRSSIYDTFGGKYGLFVASLQRYQEQARKVDVKPVMDQQVDLAAFLRTFFKKLVTDCLQDKEKKGCFLVNSSVELAPHDKKIDEVITSNMEAFVDNFTLLFQHQIEQGVLSAEKDPRALAHFLYANMSSLKLISRTGCDAQVLEDIARLAVHGILA